MTAWQPSATFQTLTQRAQILKQIRDFFAARDVLEVETPLLCSRSVTDPFIQSIPVMVEGATISQPYYLQTSPEYAMKRLLAAGSGSIYQMGKSFRQGEVGRLHNPEFTMLEWYRMNFDDHQLMNEVDDLLQCVLQMPKAERVSYQDLFQNYLGINPHHTTLQELSDCAHQLDIQLANDVTDVTTWLDILMTHQIEPQLGFERPCFIYDYPVAQAALARVKSSVPPVAARFEVYVHGMELANGFHELQDAREQRARFEKNNTQRQQLGLNEMPIDENFIAALQHGLPNCAGVALGVDRLIMIATKMNKVADVISFDFKRV